MSECTDKILAMQDRIEALEAAALDLHGVIAARAIRIGRLEAALREIKDQYLSPDQSSAIARAALAEEQDK
jgi:hypothetical protein